VKILVAIAHHFNAHGDGKYVSTSANSAPRLEACRACITSLYRLFGRRQYQWDIAAWNAVPVNPSATHELDVVLCTIPFKVIEQLAYHPLTDIGLKKFIEDGKKIPAG
jgi:hypothetical protein